jgi:hypothetical protein
MTSLDLLIFELQLVIDVTSRFRLGPYERQKCHLVSFGRPFDADLAQLVDQNRLWSRSGFLSGSVVTRLCGMELTFAFSQ